ncbi:hypothetical protein KJ632_02880 [Patescibacteria group bacterium]|nr:hypothetical protein [Patescibacteria group bacterium]
MRVTIWKNDKESSERSITRFNKKVQGSRKILKLKAEKFHAAKLSKRKVRDAAVLREGYRAINKKNAFYN